MFIILPIIVNSSGVSRQSYSVMKLVATRYAIEASGTGTDSDSQDHDCEIEKSEISKVKIVCFLCMKFFLLIYFLTTRKHKRTLSIELKQSELPSVPEVLGEPISQSFKNCIRVK